MILKSGKKGEWNYKQLPDEITTFFENGFYHVLIKNDSGEVIDHLECTGQECYLMSDNGKTIENLSSKHNNSL